jgi:hypothetical protein
MSLTKIKASNITSTGVVAGSYTNTSITVNESGQVTGISSGAPAGVLPWSRKTANYTAISGDRLIADTSGGAFTITLPANPTAGNSVVITDGANLANTNLTVARNGSTIEGYAEDVLVDIPGTTCEFICYTANFTAPTAPHRLK